MMKQSRLMVTLSVALAGVLVADSVSAQQPAPAPAPSVAGAYTLAQVDDAQLPAVIGEENGCRREITAATLTLQPDNKWALEAKIRETCGEKIAEKTANQAGSFTANADALEFKPGETAAPAVAPAADAAAGANAAATTGGNATANTGANAAAGANTAANAGANPDASKATIQLPAITAGTVSDNTITVAHGEKKLVFKR